jgi:hypothetical protein
VLANCLHVVQAPIKSMPQQLSKNMRHMLMHKHAALVAAVAEVLPNLLLVALHACSAEWYVDSMVSYHTLEVTTTQCTT